MQILYDDKALKFQIYDLDFLEMVFLTDALAYWAEHKHSPVADTLKALTSSVELACKIQRAQEAEDS